MTGLIHSCVKVSENKLTKMDCSLFGHSICKSCFIFALDISDWLPKIIMKELKEEGTLIFADQVWATNCTYTGARKKCIKGFIKGTADLDGLPCPSAVRSRKKQRISPLVILPRGTKKVGI